MKTEIIFWPKDRDNSPVDEYINNQDEKIMIKLHEILEDIRDFGVYIIQKEKNYITPIEDLFEIKYKHCRILFQKLTGQIYLLHAFNKDSQKTRKKHIKLAQKRKL